jgi:hypothetical protein
MFQKLYLFPSSEEGNEAPTLLGPLERANLNPVIQRLRLALSKGPNRVSPSPHLNMKTDLVSKTYFLVM